MKNSLLVLLASLMVLNASAQLKKSDVVVNRQPLSMSHVMPQAQKQEMQMRAQGEKPAAGPRSTGVLEPYYHRPAGAFHSMVIAENETMVGTLYSGILMMKPYAEYSFHGLAEGADWHDDFWWYYTTWNSSEQQDVYHEENAMDITVKYSIETDEVPTLCVYPNGDQYQGYFFQYPNKRNFNGNSAARIYSVPETQMIGTEGYQFLLSSKTVDPSLVTPGKNMYTYYSGADPYMGNTDGWWFGKNGYHQVVRPSYFIDGIAQAFEKPSAPYVLKRVAMYCAVLDVTDQVEMNCRVYRLDEIPPYIDQDEVSLPEVPGELIAVGHATLTPETWETNKGLVFFNLFGEDDGLEYDITPMIDYPILIVVDGYNDPEMANLQDFSAMIASNVNDDEGFGELAYLKFGRPDDDGNVSYVWAGLNNFFTSGTMKTGFSIFIDADMPYLTFRYDNEDGEYFFDREGGLMEKDLGDVTTRSIEFLSWTPSADDEWYVHRKGEEELPDWLEIELYDDEQDGEWNGIVTAEVIADPLPAGVRYREAVVRFEFLGAYLDYKFIQRDTFIPPVPCGPGADGEINIGDLNYLIHLILNHMYDSCWDVDQDGELTIADINALINIILYD